MTFNEWFGKQKLLGGNIVEIAHDIARKAWEASRQDLKEAILNRSGGRIYIDEQEWEDEDDI